MSFRDVIKKSVLESFSGSNITTTTVCITLGITIILALYVFAVYYLSTRKTFYNKTFNVSLAAIAVITASIILAMQSNLAISLGMVGALSIVRFRTAIKEPSDIASLFWAIAAGIILAAGFIPLAVFGSLFIGLILLIFSRYKGFEKPYILVVHCENTESENGAHSFVEQRVKKLSVKSKSVAPGCIELNYEVRLKDANTDFINELAELPGVSHTVMVSYNGDYMS